MFGKCGFCKWWQCDGEEYDKCCTSPDFIRVCYVAITDGMHERNKPRRPEALETEYTFSCAYFSPNPARMKKLKQNASEERLNPMTGDDLRELLKRSGLTQSDLAALLLVDRQRVSGWIQGKSPIYGPVVVALQALGLRDTDDS